MQYFLYFLPLLQWQRSFPSDFGHLANFHEQLLVFDRDLAASARRAVLVLRWPAAFGTV
jgi:hypothetical protein